MYNENNVSPLAYHSASLSLNPITHYSLLIIDFVELFDLH